MPQDSPQAPVVALQHALEEALRSHVEPAVSLGCGRPHKPAAQHRRECERYKPGNQHSRGDGHRKFVQQAAENSSQKEHRNKHCRQRKRHGENSEADFLRAVERRLHHAFALFHVADNIFQHHDGVIHHEADRKRQSHEREVVHRIAQQVHDRERADDRHWEREAGNDGCRKIAQEEEDHHHDERDGEVERKLHVLDRSTNCFGPVVADVHVNPSGDLRPKAWQQLADVVHYLDGVRARLLPDGQNLGLRAVLPHHDLIVLHAVDDVAQLFQPHRRAVAIGDNQRTVSRRFQELAGGLDGKCLVGAGQQARG